MMKIKGYSVLIILTICCLLLACSYKKGYKEDALLQLAQSYLKPIERSSEGSLNENVALGRRLFLDTNLSLNRDLSCNSCHNLKKYGVDGLAFSLGNNGFKALRNTPTVYNASLQFAQMWDGSAADLLEQAKGPLFNGHEMALADEAMLVERVREFYLELDTIEDDSIPQKVYQALSDFQSTLITPSPFDDYLKGDVSALNEKEKKGLQLYIETGCTPCHGGATIGGQLIQPFPINGKISDYLKDSISDRLKLKVPSLRNVAKTAPYFHDGSVSDLKEAIDIMARAQTNTALSQEEIGLISEFLETLSGEIEL